MTRTLLSNSQWTKIEPLLSGKIGDCGVTCANNRLFVEAVLWIARTGSPWRDLPAELGNWHTTYTRFSRCCKRGRWLQIMQALGRSRGGLSTKIHAAVDALGNPLHCLLSGGQVADVTHAQALIEGIKADAVLTNKAYPPTVTLSMFMCQVLADNVIRLLMAQAACHAGVDPRSLSFKHTVQLWTEWVARGLSATKDCQRLFTLIVQCRVGHRA